MAYGLEYYFEFEDTVITGPANWRVEIARKDFVGEALLLPFMSENPLTISRTAEEENKLAVFIGSKATIRYVYDGSTNTPHPRVFKDVQEDTLLVSVYKNEVLNFKGYVKPDAAQYPWVYPPFNFEINATDYINGFKNINIDLNDSGIFFYNFMNVGAFFHRTLFRASSYEGVLMDMLFRLKVTTDPNVSGTLFENLYLHTDAFYTLDDGADTVYTALTKVLQSLRCRLFFSAGRYWVQRLADAWLPYTQVQRLDNTTTIGSYVTISDSHVTIPSDNFIIVEDSGLIRTAPAIFSQKSTFKLKAINQLLNFKFDQLITTGIHTGWPVDWDTLVGGTVTRRGTGSTEDSYNMEVSGSSGGVFEYLSQTILDIPSETYIQLDAKAGMYYSKGQKVRVQYGDLYMDSSGNWMEDPDTRILISGNKKTRQGSVSIVSKRLPEVGAGLNFLVIAFSFIEAAADPEDPVPVGEIVRNYIYPVFLRIFDNLVTAVETNTTNDKIYSNIPSDENLVFIDMADPKLSNCIYYRPAGDPVPIPLTDWVDVDTSEIKNIEEWAGRTILDEFNVSSNTVEVDILSNNLEFHQTIILPDLDDEVRLVQISDSYNVKDGIHSILAEQVYEKGTGTGTYTTKSIAK